MFELFFPYLIGAALGIDPQGRGAANSAPEQAIVDPTPEAPDSRVPEPQVPTGKYTTALEVKPILGMTKGNWVAVRNFNGQDLLYFTHLLAWRCGLWDVRYGINGAPADQIVALEPCHDDMATPNALIEIEQFLPYVTLPADSVETVYVELTFDDGTTDFAQFSRNEIQIP